MKEKIFKLEIHLNEHCNLNCTCCDHFSTLAEEEYANYESVENDFKRMSELLGEDRRINIYLLGGEPLLNPRLLDYIKLTRKYFPIRDNIEVRIITNGILLDQQPEEFWKVCGENKIMIAPSRYKLKIDYESIYKKAEKYNVETIFFHSDDIVETMNNVPLLINRKADRKKSFENCYAASRCVFLKEGKIYCCPRIANIYHFNKFFNTDFKVDESDYLDIYKINSFEEIEEYLNTPKKFCENCDAANVKTDVKWKISEKKIEEWASID